MSVSESLIQLAHVLGEPQNDLCICAEGNVSQLDGDALWIKGSGAQMRSIDASEFAHVRIDPVLQAFDEPFADESAVRARLNESCLNLGQATPSTETFMHAWLLSECGAQFVAHSHPTPLLSLLVLPDIEIYARRRLFPDEIVLCGPSACFVPYAAPGLPLARLIKDRAVKYRERVGHWPKTVWLQNHGLICLGQTGAEAAAASLMSVKAARVVLGALQTGMEPHWMSPGEVEQIHQWPDEHARQKLLFGQ